MALTLPWIWYVLVMKKLPPLKVGERHDGVWRRREDTYVVSIRLNGKHHQRSFGSDYEAAALYADRIRLEHKIEKLRGENPLLEQVLQKKQREISVGELVLTYLQDRERFHKPATAEFYSYLLTRLKPITKISVNQLTPELITSYIGDLKEGSDLKAVSNKTIKEILSLCRSAFRWAVDMEKIAPSKNVFEKVKIPKVEKHEPDPFTAAEVEKIFEELNPKLRFMFWVQFVTGIRSGELISLRFADINFEQGRIRINKTTRRGVEGTVKTAKADRIVFAPKDVIADLKFLMEERKADLSDYIFLTQYGLPYTDVPHEPWKEALTRAGVAYRRPYTLRHTFASHSLSNNVKLSYVSEALGHAHVNVTAEKYIRYISDLNTEDEAKISSFTQLVRKRSAPENIESGK